MLRPLTLMVFAIRRLSSICRRLRRRYGVQFAVISPVRGVYTVQLFCDNLGDWFSLRTCRGVAATVDYLLGYELVKGVK